MATITYNNSHFSNFMIFLDKIRKNIDRSTSLMENIKNYFILLYQLARIESISSTTIEELKKMLANCNDDCEHCPECWNKILDISHQGRDSLMHVIEILPKNNMLFKPARQRLEAVLIDWDDLIEDLTVCSDEEFRDLVKQLSPLV